MTLLECSTGSCQAPEAEICTWLETLCIAGNGIKSLVLNSTAVSENTIDSNSPPGIIKVFRITSVLFVTSFLSGSVPVQSSIPEPCNASVPTLVFPLLLLFYACNRLGQL